MTAPPNDNFASALALTLDSLTTGTLAGSTVEANEFNSWDVVYGDGIASQLRDTWPLTVWYKWTSSSDADVTLSADFSETSNGYIIVYSGSGSATQDTIAPVYAFTAGNGTLSATSGVTYYFQVVSTTVVTTPGTFTFTAASPSAGPRDLSSNVVAYAQSRTTLGLAFKVPASTASGKSSARGELSRNTFYATVHGKFRSPVASLSVNDNTYVKPYPGDPSAPPGGAVSAGTPSLKSDAITYPAIGVLEAIGATPRVILLGDVLTLLCVDAHSGTDPRAYTQHPVKTGTHSYERWIQFRFAEPFNTVDGLRFWSATNLNALIPGWTIRWGVSATYQPPTSNASSIAINDMPTSDPGLATHQLLNSPVSGNETRYSNWLVLQASVNGSTAPGALMGFIPENSEPVPLQLQFAWVET